MEEKTFDFVAAAAMLDADLYSDVMKLRNYIRDVRSACPAEIPGEKLCVPLSGKKVSPEELRTPEETGAERADISQSGHCDGDSVRVPRVVA